MKVVCDNCGAIYKIPEKKLVKDVNKATCRKCGHRILIRRDAVPGAPPPTDGEEATLIAQPAQPAAAQARPEPVPAPAVTYPPFGQPAEEPTPLPTSPMDARSAAAPAAPQAYAPPPTATPYPVVPQTSSQAPQMPPQLSAPFASAPAASTPPTPTPAPVYASPRHAAPVSQGAPPPRAGHDPAVDLGVVTVAQVGVLVAMLVLALADLPSFISFICLLVALWGVFTTLLVVVSGTWGRRPAWVVSSGFLGLFLAVVLAGSIKVGPVIVGAMGSAGFGSFMDRITEVASQEPAASEPPAPPPASAATQPPPPPEVPPAAPATADAAGPAAEGPRDLLDVIAVASPPAEEPTAVPPAPEPAPAPAPAPAPTASSRTPPSTASASSSRSSSSSGSTPSSASSSRSSSSSGSTPSSAGSSASSSRSSSSSGSTPSSASSSRATSTTPSAATSSSTASSGATSIPTTVIDIQIRNNKNIKACFLAHKQTSGSLPSVTLRFTIEPDGRVTSGSIRETEFQGTSLESCLVGSVKLIEFPPFDGPSYTLNYPFRF